MTLNNNIRTIALSGSGEQFTDWMASGSDLIAKVTGTFVGSILVQSRIDENDTDIVTIETFTAVGQKISNINTKKSLEYRIGVEVSGLTSGTPIASLVR